MLSSSLKKVAVIVAHPDDETLWVGGTILSHPQWTWFIVCLCRKSDKDRAEKFYRALKIYHAKGAMGDLDDGPEQTPLSDKEVEFAIECLIPPQHFDILISHSPSGEYTRHRRHEETGKAVIHLWHAGKIQGAELWVFAYQDGERAYYPRPIEEAKNKPIPEHLWNRKYQVITENYGFEPESWEARTTPRTEAFWQFTDSENALNWLNEGDIPI